MGAGRAGGDHRMVRPLGAEFDGNEAGGEIDQGARNEERADPARALFGQEQCGLFDAGQAADAGADEDAGAALLFVGLGLPARILHRLLGGGHRIDDEIVVAAQFLVLHPVLGIESAVGAVAALHFIGDAARHVRGVEFGDGTGARLTGQQPLPGFLNAGGQRRDDSKTRDDDPTHAQLSLSRYENAAAGCFDSPPPRR